MLPSAELHVGQEDFCVRPVQGSQPDTASDHEPVLSDLGFVTSLEWPSFCCEHAVSSSFSAFPMMSCASLLLWKAQTLFQEAP